MLDVNRILKLHFILSENKQRNYYYSHFQGIYYYSPSPDGLAMTSVRLKSER